VNLVADNLSRKLAFAGTVAATFWVAGLYFAFQPMTLLGLPYAITAGVLEWASTIFALGAGAWCMLLLYRAFRCRGVAWWAYVIGLVTTGGTVLVALIASYALFNSYF
jgi:hypothetical protein